MSQYDNLNPKLNIKETGAIPRCTVSRGMVIVWLAGFFVLVLLPSL